MNICLNYEAEWKVPGEHKWLMQHTECAKSLLRRSIGKALSTEFSHLWDVKSMTLWIQFLRQFSSAQSLNIVVLLLPALTSQTKLN